MKALDFFCGAGGLTAGLRMAGITVLAGFDSDPECKKTYKANNSRSKFVLKDIRDISLNDLKRSCRTTSFDDILFAGCAPCQPFSTQHKVIEPKSKTKRAAQRRKARR